MAKTKAELKKEITIKMEKLEGYIKKLQQQVDRNEVTLKSYFAINTSAFHIDQLMWEYLKK